MAFLLPVSPPAPVRRDGFERRTGGTKIEIFMTGVGRLNRTRAIVSNWISIILSMVSVGWMSLGYTSSLGNQQLVTLVTADPPRP